MLRGRQKNQQKQLHVKELLHFDSKITSYLPLHKCNFCITFPI